MIVLILYITISFLLDGLFSILIPFNDTIFFKTFFILISIIIMFPYISKDKKMYYIITFVMGLLFDITYTNTLPLNAILFLLIAFVIENMYMVLKNNLLNGIVIVILILFLYNLFNYLILNIIGITTYPFSILFKQLLFIDMVNIIYYIISYILIIKYADKVRLQYIDK